MNLRLCTVSRHSLLSFLNTHIENVKACNKLRSFGYVKTTADNAYKIPLHRLQKHRWKKFCPTQNDIRIQFLKKIILILIGCDCFDLKKKYTKIQCEGYPLLSYYASSKGISYPQVAPKRQHGITSTRSTVTQKSAVHNYFVMEVWNQTKIQNTKSHTSIS